MYICTTIGLISSLPYLLKSIPFAVTSVLAFVGKLSLEFYLIHVYIMVRYINEWFCISKSQMVTIIAIFIVTLLSSYGSQYILNKLLKQND